MYNEYLKDLNELPLISDSEYQKMLHQKDEYKYTDMLELSDFFFDGVIDTDPSDNLKQAVEEVYKVNLYDISVFRTSWNTIYVSWVF